jgi:uncharacterized protein YutE (UPF0331/DUF86 family)
MVDITINKVSLIERCLIRIKAEYSKTTSDFSSDFARQDSVILNIERAIQACLDIGTHIIRIRKLGVPQTSREIFEKLGGEGIITDDLSQKMQRMVGFRNIAVHDYQKLNLDVVKNIAEKHLKDFEDFKTSIIKHSS